MEKKVIEIEDSSVDSNVEAVAYGEDINKVYSGLNIRTSVETFKSAVSGTGRYIFLAGSGIHKLDKNSFTIVESYYTNITFYCSVKNASNDAFFGGSVGSLYRWSAGTFTKITGISSSTTINALFVDSTGRLWILTENGLYLYNSSNVSATALDTTMRFKCVEESKSGTLYFGTQNTGVGGYGIKKITRGSTVIQDTNITTGGFMASARNKSNTRLYFSKAYNTGIFYLDEASSPNIISSNQTAVTFLSSYVMSDIVYLGANNSGNLYADNGISIELVKTFDTSGAIWSIFEDPDDPLMLYIGTSKNEVFKYNTITNDAEKVIQGTPNSSSFYHMCNDYDGGLLFFANDIYKKNREKSFDLSGRDITNKVIESQKNMVLDENNTGRIMYGINLENYKNINIEGEYIEYMYDDGMYVENFCALPKQNCKRNIYMYNNFIPSIKNTHNNNFIPGLIFSGTLFNIYADNIWYDFFFMGDKPQEVYTIGINDRFKMEYDFRFDSPTRCKVYVTMCYLKK